MISKRLILFTLFALFAVACEDSLHAQWVQVNAPYGDSITAIAASGTNVFAGTKNNLFSSTDNGVSWSRAGNGLASPKVASLAVIGNIGPNKETYPFVSLDSGGIYYSTDNGTTWISDSNGLPTNSVVTTFSLIDTSGGPSLDFVGTQRNGIFLSTDGGASWMPVDTGLPPNFNVTAIAAIGASRFAGSDGNGVYLSTNNGTSWNPVNLGLSDTNVLTLAVIDSNLFAGTNDGVYLSTNNGTSWNKVNSGLPSIAVTSLSVNGTNIFAGTQGDGVYLSANNGTTWTAISSSLPSLNVTALVSNGANLFAGTTVDVYRSSDTGKTWSAANFGLKDTDISSFAVSGSNLFAGSNDGVSLSTDDGTSWTIANFGLPPNISILGFVMIGSNLFATTGSGIYLSTNNGGTWTLTSGPGVNSFALSRINLFASSGDGPWLSTDSGVRWVNESNPGFDNSNRRVSSLAVIDTNIFAGTNGGLLQTINNGANWNFIFGLPVVQVTALTVSGSYLFAATYSTASGIGYISRSSDYGADWTTVDSTGYIWTLAADGSNIFAGLYDGGVFLSTNNGTDWISASSGLPFLANINAFAIKDSNVFLGTEAFGVWRRPLSNFGISSVAPQQAISQSFSVYPNPFTQSTIINFTSPESGAAQVSIVNLLGAEVARLFVGELSAGEHTFMWSKPTGLLPGAYWAVVRMNGTSQEIPIVLQP